VNGFAKAVFSGFTTPALVRIINDVIDNYPELQGLYQVSAEPINKYDLLVGLKKVFNISIEIEPHYEIVIDRSLDSSKFRRATGFKPESWNLMLSELTQATALYDKWRGEAHV
jgi:dTDP-4-dehydrorhamnose reductase